MNAVEIEEAVSRLAEDPFDPEEFPFAFLDTFGNKSTTIKRLKSGSSNQSASTDWRTRLPILRMNNFDQGISTPEPG